MKTPAKKMRRILVAFLFLLMLACGNNVELSDEPLEKITLPAPIVDTPAPIPPFKEIGEKSVDELRGMSDEEMLSYVKSVMLAFKKVKRTGFSKKEASPYRAFANILSFYCMDGDTPNEALKKEINGGYFFSGERKFLIAKQMGYGYCYKNEACSKVCMALLNSNKTLLIR